MRVADPHYVQLMQTAHKILCNVLRMDLLGFKNSLQDLTVVPALLFDVLPKELENDYVMAHNTNSMLFSGLTQTDPLPVFVPSFVARIILNPTRSVDIHLSDGFGSMQLEEALVHNLFPSLNRSRLVTQFDIAIATRFHKIAHLLTIPKVHLVVLLGMARFAAVFSLVATELEKDSLKGLIKLALGTVA